MATYSYPVRCSQRIDEWLEQALACAEKFTSLECEVPGNADVLFISYLLSRLRFVGVTNAKHVMDRLHEKRVEAIYTKLGSV